MNNYNKLGVAAGQLFVGFGFSILGGIVGMLCNYIGSVTSVEYLEYYGVIIYALIGSYIGLLTGVCFDGYRFLKQEGRQNDFIKFLLVSVAGISGGLFALYLIFANSFNLELPNILSRVLTIALPLMGILLGSILILMKEKKQT